MQKHFPQFSDAAQIAAKFSFHSDRATYYLLKKDALPDHARRRRVLCQRLYIFHMRERAKLLPLVVDLALTQAIPS